MTATLLSPDPSSGDHWTATDYGYGISEPARELSKRAAEARRHFDEPLRSRAPDVEARFVALAHQWDEETAHLSSSTALFMHPAYQQIIGLGRAVIPLLLRDLAATRNHWFWALQAISGESPVAPEDRGYVDRMANAWLIWGIKNRFL